MTSFIIVAGIASIIFFSGLLIGVALMMRHRWEPGATPDAHRTSATTHPHSTTPTPPSGERP